MIAATSVALLATLAVPDGIDDRRPNLVFILADDLGINDLGCYGRRDHPTPHLDRLAAQGTRFLQAYAAQCVCSPTRAALLTGRDPARLHLTTFLPGRPDVPAQPLLHPKIVAALPASEVTLAEALQAAGYRTGLFGKWHLGGDPTDQGFDAYEPGQANHPIDSQAGTKGESDLVDRAIAFLRSNREVPTFVHLCHNSPHIPYAAAPDAVARHADAFEPTYAAVIASLDRSIGRLLDALDELGLVDHTLVVFTSDNGGLHVPEGQHERTTHNTPYRAGKGYLYEGGIRVPLLARWPGRIAAGRSVENPVISTDWYPTALECLGVSPPDGPPRDGVSYASILLGAKAPTPERVLTWHLPHYTNQGGRPSGAIRIGDWKLIEHYESGQVELFNLANDPGEARDLAARHPVRLRNMQKRLRDRLWALDARHNAPNLAWDAPAHRAIYADFDSSRYDPAQADPAGRDAVRAWRRAMNAATAKRPAR